MAQHTDQEPADDPVEELTEAEETPEGTIRRLEAEVTALTEKWMRAQADYQNLRRRSVSEHESGLKRTLQPLLDELLLVLDYLELALAAPATSPEAKNLATGVEMTRVKLLQALESVEVYPIATDGPFDPQLHDAGASRVDHEAEPGSILETIRKGYTWKDLVLRPAQVVVATAPDEGSDEEE